MSIDSTTATTMAFRFANFELVPARELLLDGAKPVRVGSRAIRILIALVERAGELVGKNELIDLVWPDTFVEEGNLKVQLSALRKILGDAGGRFIANVPGRGYRFIADVARVKALPGHSIGPAKPPGRAPALLTRVIGRGRALQDVEALLARERLVTVVGAGGIGKTTLAIAVTDRVAPDFEHHPVFVELGAISDPALLAAAVASALGSMAVSGDPLDQLVELVAAKDMLLVLDNCEQVVDRAAALVEALLSRTPSLKILATSLEPLRARGEQVYRLGPLDFPTEGPALDAASALTHSAVELFVERARSSAGSTSFEDSDVQPVLQICRQLDGLPLALELAAARLPYFGFANLAARLDDRFSLLTNGWRTAMPRQQTLRATLDWSFELLAPSEQALFSRLGVFADSFTLDAALAVGRDPDEDKHDLLDDLSSLGDKSMLQIDISADTVRFGMLESARAYALERLRASGEFDAIAARRARAVHDLFAAARQQWSPQAAGEWLETHRHWVGDVRASLDSSFSADGDIELGASLVLETSQLWIGLGLLPEFFQHAERALDALARCEGDEKPLEMRLSSALGHAIYEIGAHPTLSPTMTRLFERALQLAGELGDARQEVRALFSQCTGCVGSGEYADILPLADRMLEVGERLPDGSGVSLLYNQSYGIGSAMLGRNPDAQRHLDAALADPSLHNRASNHEGFLFDPLILTQGLQARLLWMTGFPDQSMAVVRGIVEDALSLGHLPTYLNALQSCVMLMPVWYGDAAFHADELERYVAFGQAHNLDYRGLWRTVLDLGWRSNVEDWSHARARQAIVELNTPFNVYGNEMWAAYHSGFVLPEMLGRVRAGKSGWCAPEVIRALGEERLGAGDTAGAREAFDEALRLAREQGSRAWELRAATSLCRLDGGQGPGRDALASVYGAYTEGFAARDLKRAGALLGER